MIWRWRKKNLPKDLYVQLHTSDPRERQSVPVTPGIPVVYDWTTEQRELLQRWVDNERPQPTNEDV